MPLWKRKIIIGFGWVAILGGAIAPAACQRQGGSDAVTVPGPEDWTRLPFIEQVEVGATGLRATGSTAPLGRVVLRQDWGQAYAVSADAQGRFSLPFRRPVEDSIFIVESQLGQDSIPAGYALFVSANPEAPIARIEMGRASVRLDRTSFLDAIDTDGAVVIASGHVGDPGGVQIGVDAGLVTVVPGDKTGRWERILGPVGSTPMTVTVEGKAYIYPGPDRDRADGLYLEPGGWRLVWSTGRAARQEAWFPDLPR